MFKEIFNESAAGISVGPKGLWVVATPIGNLSDISPRTVQALRQADRILCEDTRRARQLISALGLDIPATRLKRLDAHVEKHALGDVVRHLQENEISIALISDAGTPAVSDPGALLVRACLDAGIAVTPVPGPSAVLTLLAAAGISSGHFTFRGFFPRKSSEQKSELKRCLESPDLGAFIWFESPKRMAASLESVARVVSSNRDARVVAAKELTKLHEKFFSGSPEDVLERVQNELTKEGEKGEWCFLLEIPFAEASGASHKSNEASRDEQAGWEKALLCLLESEVPASASARKVSQYFGISRNQAYAKALDLSRNLFGKK